MSIVRTDIITSRTGAGTITIPAGNVLRAPGHVIQVVSKTFNDTTSTTTNNTYVAVTNGSLAIVAKSPSSQFLVMMQMQGYQASGGGSNIAINRTIGASTVRLLGTDGSAGDTWMGSGNGAASNSWNIKRDFLDTPSVAAGTTLTYSVLVGRWSSGTVFINYPGYTGGSTITIMEIAQ
jgi:hypothetical protein